VHASQVLYQWGTSQASLCLLSRLHVNISWGLGGLHLPGSGLPQGTTLDPCQYGVILAGALGTTFHFTT
jgi:hypothetical protein